MDPTRSARPREILAVAIVTGLLGLSMLAYWTLFLARGIPADGIPIASELLNAALALTSAYGLYRMRRWGYALGLLTAGMWLYGLTGGIWMVAADGLAFESPIGALTDAILFFVVLGYTIYMATALWRARARFV